MKAIEYKTIGASGSVHPHGHTDQNTGPFSLRIGIQSQPAMLHKGRGQNPPHVLIHVEQPNADKDNFTLIYVLYLSTGTRKPPLVMDYKFHRAKQYRRSGTIEVRIKKRLCDSFPSPLPVGRYQGTCVYDPKGTSVLFTLQARTLTKKEPEPAKPKLILTPGDEGFNESLRDTARTLRRTYGVEWGRPDASGLRNG